MDISMPRLLWWRTAYDDNDVDYEDEYDECDDCHGMTPNKNLMPHDQFLQRIRKTLYVGGHVSTSGRCVSAPSANSQKISRPLADYAADYFSGAHRGHSLSRLHSVTVARLNATPCSLILAMIYVDRLHATSPAYARRITPAELFLVSMLVSSKFYYGYDESVHIDDFLDAGEQLVSLERLKALELELLDALNWNVYVSNADFFAKLCTVERELAQRQGCARGWLTYTELSQLFPSLAIAGAFLKYSTVFAVGYAASVFTIAGAFLLASQMPGSALYRPAPTAAITPNASRETGPPTTTPAVPLDDATDASDAINARLANDAEEAQATTSQDRGFERLADGFDTPQQSESMPSMRSNNVNSTAHHRNHPAAYSTINRTWTTSLPPSLRQRHRQQFVAHDSVVNLRSLLSTTPPPAARTHVDWMMMNGTELDDMMPVGLPDTTCRRASGYETLLMWRQFM